MGIYQTINLEPYVNNRGMTYEKDYQKGKLTLGNASFPAELLLKEQEPVIHGIPFEFIYINKGDNIELEGQSIQLGQIKAEALHIVGCACNGNLYEDVTFLLNGHPVHQSRLSLTDVIEQEPAFSDRLALSFNYIHTVTGINRHLGSRLWHDTLSLPKGTLFDEIQFEDNPSMHIFAMTLEMANEG
ncbi:hypothetical protein [Bacillus sp. NPDC077027]|uniref:hypothetical protein n=1 Tax=Bacillus sp. NPDC077027 TaxID=3390548 RepID=UPI003D01DEB3